MRFYLGADVAGLSWGVPVMISHGRLRDRKTLPVATAPWVCDSRGFSEIKQYGRWTITAVEYAASLRRYAREIGQLRWASPQDWMCEDDMLARTGKTVLEHQELTIKSVIELRALLAGEVHIIPVLQGQTIADYLRHVEMYRAAGIDLTKEKTVGVGSVCRRQASNEIREIMVALAAQGLRLHGFGVKTEAMDTYGPILQSADSFAWSMAARYEQRQCRHGLVKWERNCPAAALEWRAAVLARLEATLAESRRPTPVTAKPRLATVRPAAVRTARVSAPSVKPRRRRPVLFGLAGRPPPGVLDAGGWRGAVKRYAGKREARQLGV